MSSTPLILPQLAAVYRALAPWADTLIRIVVGLALVPHGLRFSFGWFPNSGSRIMTLGGLGTMLDAKGYRPGRLWAIAIAVLELAGGPMLALGLFTRPVALAGFVFLVMGVIEHWRFDGYFWNKLGLEYPMIWSAAMLVFVIYGGGPVHSDSLLLRHEF